MNVLEELWNVLLLKELILDGIDVFEFFLSLEREPIVN